MKPFNKSPFNSQEPFPIGKTTLIPELELNTENLLNPQTLSSHTSEPALELPGGSNHNPESSAIFSKPIKFSREFKESSFTPPRKKIS